MKYKKILEPNFVFLFYLGMLSIIGFISTDMYLPAFKQIEESLNINSDLSALSLSVFLFGLACGQILTGLIAEKKSDRYALSLGLLIFTASSFILFLTNNHVLFIIARLIQGVGASAPSVIWQSIAIKRFNKDQSKTIFRKIMPLVALSPALAPILGAMITKALSWQFIFFILGLIALFLLGFTQKNIKNDLANNKQANQAIISFTDMLKNKIYFSNVILYSLCSAIFFAFLTGWPKFMNDLGCNELHIAISFIPQTLFFMFGGYSLKKLNKKYSDLTLLKFLTRLILIASIFILLLSFVFNRNVLMVMLPFCFIAFANGAVYPIVVHKSLSVFPENSAKAAGLQNFVNLAICSLSSLLVSQTIIYSAFYATVFVMIAISFMLYLFYIKKFN